MKIIQITALPDDGAGDTIYGLGDDGLLYWWDAGQTKWQLAKADDSDT